MKTLNIRTVKNIAICVADSETKSAMSELGSLMKSAARAGGLTYEEQIKFAALAEHILSEFCDPEVADYAQENPIPDTPEASQE